MPSPSFSSWFKTTSLTLLLLTGTSHAANISTPAPSDAGVPYSYMVFMNGDDTAEIANHVGAWSWEDNSLFGNPGQGTQPVGWTHTSRWVALSLTQPTVLVVSMARDASVPWPDVSDPNRKADTSSMFPSFTIWNGWDTDGDQFHTYNNRGNMSWAEKLVYRDHYDNSTAASITRTYVLPAGTYTLALGSNAPATNPNRQGFKCTLTTSMISASDPQEGGITYAYTVISDGKTSGSLSSHVGAWSWEDNSLFGNPGQGAQPVGWTHTSRWVALRVSRPTIFTMTMERDATVPWPDVSNPDRLADTSSMFPSFTIWNGWDNDGDDFHTYNNRGNVDWAEKLTYRDHFDNSTATSITRSYFLPAGDYTLALGSNAPATNPSRQGFKLTYSSATVSKSDPVPNTYPDSAPSTGGVGYACTLLLGNGDYGSLSNHVGAWSWEDNSLFGNPGQGAQPVGWTHTSCWAAVSLEEDSLLTLTVERDANVPWPSVDNPDRKADTSSMFPSLTLWKGWDNDGSDFHTYNNRGRVSWAEDLTYVDHIDNSTDTVISRTWRLPAGQYTLALGSNAPATNPSRQGFKLSYFVTSGNPGASGGDPVANTYPDGAPSTGGIGYNATHVLGPDSTSGRYSDHVGAWSWEDNSLFDASAGDPPVGWTHTSNWIALNVTQTLTFEFTVERDANVPWPSVDNPNRKADTSSMFPSLTLWKGWDNDGSDFHTYNNRGNMGWAEDLTYMDHVDNSTRSRITRAWTLPPGNYTLALGSNAPATNPNRQGFRYSYITRAPVLTSPKITSQPSGVTLVSGKTFRLKVAASGPGLEYQWFKDGRQINDANVPTLELPGASARDSGAYHVRVRNAAGRVDSRTVQVTVLEAPTVSSPLLLPPGMIGQPYTFVIPVENTPATVGITGLPSGLALNPGTGRISGRPMKSGRFMLTVSAANAAGRTAPITTELLVSALPPGLVGTFTGNVPRSVSMNEFLGGGLSVTMSKLGAFTGSLQLGQSRRAFSGTLTGLDGTPSGVVPLARQGRSALRLELQFEVASGRMTGQLSDDLETAALELRLPSASPSTYQGRHTFALGLGEANIAAPQGHGLGSFLASPGGLASGAIKLADGTALTFSRPVEVDGGISLFQVLHAKTGGMIRIGGTARVRAVTVLSGSFLARLIMDSGDGHRLEGSQASWYRMPTPSNMYPAGFGPLNLDVVGGRYPAPRNSTVQLTFTHGELAGVQSSPDVTGTLSSTGTPKFITNPCKVTLSLNSGTGLFQGTFEVKKSGVTRTAAYQAALVDGGDADEGLGFFLITEFPRPGRTAEVVSGDVSMDVSSAR